MSSSKLDELLDEYSDDIGYLLVGGVERKWSGTRADEQRVDRNNEAKQQLKDLILEIIGEDHAKKTRSLNGTRLHCNRYKAKLRKAVEDL